MKKKVISSAEIVYFHYSLLYQRVRKNVFNFFNPLESITSCKALKVAMPQDEGNCPGTLDDLLVFWGVDILLSVHYSEDGILYPNARKRMKIINVLPAFIKNEWLNKLPSIPDLKTRPISLGYRGRPQIFKAGRANYLKSVLPIKLSNYLEKNGHINDVSVKSIDRIYGADWNKFIQSSRAIYGSPGGYTAIDFYGELELEVENVISTSKPTDFNAFNSLMRPGWDSYELLTITQRHFEAAYLGTPQILVESNYKNLINPDEHYVPVSDDEGSFELLIKQLADFDYLRSTVENFRRDVFRESFTYEFLVNTITTSITNYSGSNTLQTSSDKSLLKHAEARLNFLSNQKRNMYDSLSFKDFISSKLKRIIKRLYYKTRRVLFFIRRIVRFMYFSVRRLFRVSYYTIRSTAIDLAKIVLNKRD